MAEQTDLQAAREAYEREDYHEDGAFSYGDMNAFHRAARAYITVQQQRIAELEAALTPFARRWEWDNMDIAGDDPDPMYQRVGDASDVIPRTPVIIRAEFRAAHAALHADAPEGE